MIIPGPVFREAPADLRTLRLNATNGELVGETGRLSFTLIQGTFPSIAALIPQNCTWALTCSTDELEAAIAACQPFCEDGSGILRLEAAEGELTLSAAAEGEGSIRRTIPAEVVRQARIAFNLRYLRDAVAAAGDTFSLAGTSPSRPALITEGEHREVIMPMFVQWAEKVPA